MRPPTVLLVGYKGANNTGAEALLQADPADLRAVLGSDARLAVPTMAKRIGRLLAGKVPSRQRAAPTSER
jgi:hypothetical protein